MFALQLLVVVFYVDQCEIGHRHYSPGAVAIDIGKRVQLFHVNILHTRKVMKNTRCRLISVFVFTDESTHQRPAPFLGFEAALDQQRLEMTSIETEDDAVDSN